MNVWMNIALGLGITALMAGAGCRPAESADLWVDLGGERFLAELAWTEEERARGMAGRSSIGRNEAMLFVFRDEQVLEFWMKGCLIPLDILYLDAAGRIVSYHESMPPPVPGASLMDLPRYSSVEPARFALEVKAGTIERVGVQVGDRVGRGDLPARK